MLSLRFCATKSSISSDDVLAFSTILLNKTFNFKDEFYPLNPLTCKRKNKAKDSLMFRLTLNER